VRRAVREIFGKFFADRGTHLAAMIAYFALLSFVPLLFLALALLGLAGRPGESSYLVEELQRAFPRSSVDSLVRVVDTIRRNAAALGIVGSVGLAWTSLSLFSVLESAFNIVYGLPNRSFVRGKARALLLLLAALVTLFVGLLAGSLGADLLERFAPGTLGHPVVAYLVSVLVSLLGVLVFLVSTYHFLTNTPLTLREVLPGAATATIALVTTFQMLPLYLRLSNHVVPLQAFGGPVVLLVWLYVMSNLIVFGAEVNWWLARGAGRRPAKPGPRSG
jgi:YihY family inner membrane protein